MMLYDIIDCSRMHHKKIENVWVYWKKSGKIRWFHMASLSRMVLCLSEIFIGICDFHGYGDDSDMAIGQVWIATAAVPSQLFMFLTLFLNNSIKNWLTSFANKKTFRTEHQSFIVLQYNIRYCILSWILQEKLKKNYRNLG